MRIGVFSFDSEVAFLSERLNAPAKIPKQEIIDDMLQSCGTCLLRKVKTGIWIAGTVNMRQIYFRYFFFCNMETCSYMQVVVKTPTKFMILTWLIFSDIQLVRCPVCDQEKCEGEQ